MAMSTSLEDDVQRTWLGADKYNYCPVPGTESHMRASEQAHARNARFVIDAPVQYCETMSLTTYYLASLMWSLMVITGCGGTECARALAACTLPTPHEGCCIYGTRGCARCALVPCGNLRMREREGCGTLVHAI